MSVYQKIKRDTLDLLTKYRIPLGKNFTSKLESLTDFELDGICLGYLDDYYDQEEKGLEPLLELYRQTFGGPPKPHRSWIDTLDTKQREVLIKLLTKITHRNRGAY